MRTYNGHLQGTSVYRSLLRPTSRRLAGCHMIMRATGVVQATRIWISRRSMRIQHGHSLPENLRGEFAHHMLITAMGLYQESKSIPTLRIFC